MTPEATSLSALAAIAALAVLGALSLIWCSLVLSVTRALRTAEEDALWYAEVEDRQRELLEWEVRHRIDSLPEAYWC